MFVYRKSKFMIYFVLALLLTCTLSTISAQWNENLGLSGVIYSVEGTGATSSVDYSANGEMLAISTEDEVSIIDSLAWPSPILFFLNTPWLSGPRLLNVATAFSKLWKCFPPSELNATMPVIPHMDR